MIVSAANSRVFSLNDMTGTSTTERWAAMSLTPPKRAESLVTWCGDCSTEKRQKILHR
jgi:hypothetical protein